MSHTVQRIIDLSKESPTSEEADRVLQLLEISLNNLQAMSQMYALDRSEIAEHMQQLLSLPVEALPETKARAFARVIIGMFQVTGAAGLPLGRAMMLELDEMSQKELLKRFEPHDETPQ